MKKINVLLIAGLLSLGMIGCGSKTDSVSDASADTTTSSQGIDVQPASVSTQNGLCFETHSILVNSSEHVTVVPDIAQIVYSVRSEAREAADCQQKNAESVNQVVSLLKDLGIADTSIQTSDYYMNPVYNYNGNTPRVTGYEATTTLTVSDLPIKDLDGILAKSVSTGINTVQSITYQASQYDESYQQALTAAVNAAYQKAQVLAEAAGCQVGEVINIRETSGYSEARYNDQALANKYRSGSTKEMYLMDMEAVKESIMPGEIDVEAGIVVEYRIY